MDLRFNPYTTMPAMPSATGGVGGLGGAGRAGAGGAIQGAGGQDGFGAALKGALQSVSAAQNTAAGMQREVQMENPAVSLEETMVAIQKAQIGFQATLHVRNRMVQAYSDIMNMQV
ncbi:MAG: flagellar hook-basal body complex protein FliE [Xylophilus ampelinus]